jgi:hypothetical protein
MTTIAQILAIYKLGLLIPTDGTGAYHESYDIPGGSTGVGGFTAPSNAKYIGQMVCPAPPGCYTAGQYVGGTIPALLSTDPGSNSCAMFQFGTNEAAATGNASAVRVNNSNKAITFHKNAAWSLLFRIGCTSFPTSGAVVLGNSDGATGAGHSGLLLSFANASGQLQMALADDTGTLQLNYGGSANTTITTNSMWAVILTYAGGPAPVNWTLVPYSAGVPQTGTQQTDATSNVRNTTPTTDAFGNFTLGVKCNTTNDGASNPFAGFIGDVVVVNGVVTSQNITDYLNYLPAQNTAANTSGNFVVNVGPTVMGLVGTTSGAMLNPKDIPMGHRHFDFSNSEATETFTDSNDIPITPTVLTTPATANGASVGTVINVLERWMGLPNCALQRDYRSVASAGNVGSALPTLATNSFKTNMTSLALAGTTSTNTGLANSTGEQIGTSNTGESEHVCGDATFYLVANNMNASNGSKFIGNSVGGLTINTTAQCVVLFANSVNGSFTSNVSLRHPTQYFNAIVIRKRSNQFTTYRINPAGAVLTTSVSLTHDVYMGLDYMGVAPGGTTNALGNIWKFGVYAADIGDTNAKALILGLENGGKPSLILPGAGGGLHFQLGRRFGRG